MAVIARYRLIKRDLGILAVAFPQMRVMKGPLFPPFIPDRRFIVVSEDPEFKHYPKKEIIQITSEAEWPLDTREGMLKFLARKGVKATSYQVKVLLDQKRYEDKRFWTSVKLAVVINEFVDIPDGWEEESAPFLDLFTNLFEDFPAVFRRFEKLRATFPVVDIFCAIVAMMEKTQHIRGLAVGRSYRKILEKNKEHFALFMLGMDRYVRTPREETDLLALLSMCSLHKDPQQFFPYFMDEDYVGVELKMILKLRHEAAELRAAFRARYPTMFHENTPILST